MQSLYRIAPVFTIVLFTLTCSNLDYTPYDLQYIGDYNLSLHIDKKPLYAFVQYNFYLSSGKDRFSA
ncbi:MAG: hypothetical protein GX640_12350, partial [Fibrobacter sp.]|nr:hypothetical protein [Fibrobacter sp.]